MATQSNKDQENSPVTTADVAQSDLYQYALRMGDSTLILSHRFCEQLGTAPMLEEEIALANIGLDLLGQATAWLELAAEWQGEDKTADDLAYWRTDREYSNYLLTELENGDFARIILRCFFFTCFLRLLYAEMKKSNSAEIVAIAEKSSKEVEYHFHHLADWVERLGQGTEESHRRMTEALDFLWAYTQELFDQDDIEKNLAAAGIVPDKADLKVAWEALVIPLLQQCELQPPECKYYYDGGTNGLHTEALSYLLAEMQSVTRQYPSGRW